MNDSSTIVFACEHNVSRLTHNDEDRQALVCKECGEVLYEWSKPIHIEHFDHG